MINWEEKLQLHSDIQESAIRFITGELGNNNLGDINSHLKECAICSAAVLLVAERSDKVVKASFNSLSFFKPNFTALTPDANSEEIPNFEKINWDNCIAREWAVGFPFPSELKAKILKNPNTDPEEYNHPCAYVQNFLKNTEINPDINSYIDRKYTDCGIPMPNGPRVIIECLEETYKNIGFNKRILLQKDVNIICRTEGIQVVEREARVGKYEHLSSLYLHESKNARAIIFLRKWAKRHPLLKLYLQLYELGHLFLHLNKQKALYKHCSTMYKWCYKLEMQAHIFALICLFPTSVLYEKFKQRGLLDYEELYNLLIERLSLSREYLERHHRGLMENTYNYIRFRLRIFYEYYTKHLMKEEWNKYKVLTSIGTLSESSVTELKGYMPSTEIQIKEGNGNITEDLYDVWMRNWNNPCGLLKEDLTIFMTNKLFADKVGKELCEVVGYNLKNLNLIPSDAISKVENSIKIVKETKRSVYYETYYLLPDESGHLKLRPVGINARPVFKANGQFFASYATVDIR
ncbi:MAG: hypothetical protein V2A78_06615 [bacterium]